MPRSSYYQWKAKISMKRTELREIKTKFQGTFSLFSNSLQVVKNLSCFYI